MRFLGKVECQQKFSEEFICRFVKSWRAIHTASPFLCGDPLQVSDRILSFSLCGCAAPAVVQRV